jgi:hypothetical protein
MRFTVVSYVNAVPEWLAINWGFQTEMRSNDGFRHELLGELIRSEVVGASSYECSWAVGFVICNDLLSFAKTYE